MCVIIVCTVDYGWEHEDMPLELRRQFMAAASGLGLGGALETRGDVEVASKYCGCRLAASTIPMGTRWDRGDRLWLMADRTRGPRTRAGTGMSASSGFRATSPRLSAR